MKKILLFMILLLLPFVVYGAECSNENIEIKDLELVTTNGGAEIINDAKIVEGKLVFDIKFNKLNDSADYKILIKNNSDEDYYIDESSITSNSKNIKYTISFLEDSKIVEPGKEKYVILNIKYDTKVEDSSFNSDNEYPVDDSMSFSLTSNEKEVENTEVPVYVPTEEQPKEIKNEVDQDNDRGSTNNTNEDNPITKGSIKLVVIIAVMSIAVIALAFFGYKKESKALLILMVLSLPLIAKAMCTVKVETESHFVIEKYPNRRCYFDGELVKGAEYEEGQYVYRYLEDWFLDRYVDMLYPEPAGWSMHVKDLSSTDPLTTDMCVYINDIPVTSMAFAFTESAATEIDLSSFNTTNIVNMRGTFDASRFTSLDLSGFNTSNVRTMWGMFAKSKLKSIDISNFDTSKVENMYFMFGSVRLESLDLRTLNTDSLIDMGQMFASAEINDLNLSGLTNNKVDSLYQMFIQFEGNINLTGFKTPNVTNMHQMFIRTKANNVDFSSFDTRKVTDMNYMFDLAEIDVIDVSSFKLDSIDVLEGMFASSKARVIDISGFDTNDFTKAISLFSWAENLETIYASPSFSGLALEDTGSHPNFSVTPKLVGGAGTSCATVPRGSDNLYMRVDGGSSAPGCFTLKQ